MMNNEVTTVEVRHCRGRQVSSPETQAAERTYVHLAVIRSVHHDTTDPEVDLDWVRPESEAVIVSQDIKTDPSIHVSVAVNHS